MADFRTLVRNREANIKITHLDKIMFLGSCFAENISSILATYKFQIALNPFGIMYNPISLGNALEHLVDAKEYLIEDVFEHNSLWHSFDHHSEMSSASANEMLDKMNNTRAQATLFLTDAKFLVLTIGTAYVYKAIKSKRIVANCHKLPADNFEHILLEPAQIFERLNEVILKVKAFNQEIEIILTVSPIRHIRNGLINSQRSKSHLIAAVHQLCEALSFVNYFPAYELMMDDLRDYRFYKEDMIHPNRVAINYIWNEFSRTMIDMTTANSFLELEQLRKAVSHKPFNVNTLSHQKFIKQQLDKLEKLEQKYPSLNFDDERSYFESGWSG